MRFRLHDGEATHSITLEFGERHCQSNGRGLQNALYKDVPAINSRHSAKAEARFCLKMSRRLR